jgi:hypothetical protein
MKNCRLKDRHAMVLFNALKKHNIPSYSIKFIDLGGNPGISQEYWRSIGRFLIENKLLEKTSEEDK